LSATLNFAKGQFVGKLLRATNALRGISSLYVGSGQKVVQNAGQKIDHPLPEHFFATNSLPWWLREFVAKKCSL